MISFRNLKTVAYAREYCGQMADERMGQSRARMRLPHDVIFEGSWADIPVRSPKKPKSVARRQAKERRAEAKFKKMNAFVD